MKEKTKTQKGFIPIPILIGAILLISVSVITTIGAVKYKEEIKSAVANISSTIFKSQEEIIEEQTTEEESTTEATSTSDVIEELKEEIETLKQQTPEVIYQPSASSQQTEQTKAEIEKEEVEIQEEARIKAEQELQQQLEAQRLAEEQRQKELEKEQANEKERIANIELIDEKLSQFISIIQERIDTFSWAKNDTDSYIPTVRNKMNEYSDSSLIQQSGQQLINELNNFSFIARKLIDIDNSRIRTLSSFLGSGNSPSSNDYPFSESEYSNYLNQYNVSDTQIDSLIKTFVSNEATVLDEKIQEGEEELLRITKATEALAQLTPMIQEINSQINVLNVQIQEKEDEIEQTRNALASMSYINGKLSQLIPELNSLISQSNALIDLKEKISVITYKLDDYVNYGTPLSAEDRAFLLSLGISF